MFRCIVPKCSLIGAESLSYTIKIWGLILGISPIHLPVCIYNLWIYIVLSLVISITRSCFKIDARRIREMIVDLCSTMANKLGLLQKSLGLVRCH